MMLSEIFEKQLQLFMASQVSAAGYLALVLEDVLWHKSYSRHNFDSLLIGQADVDC